MQQGDVRLVQTIDDGEISVEGGIVAMDGGLETSAYLSMFGGNEDDSGGSDTSLSWWGNIDETEPERMYRSETQYLLRAIAAVTSNLLRIKDAVKRDLAWMIDTGVATSIEVLVTMPALNSVKITTAISAVGNESEFTFIENWKAS